MQLASWSQEISVGVEALDDDHKHLIDMLNSLFEAGKSESSRDQLRDLFDQLMDYANVHFSREEKLMEEGDYPDLAAHKESHAYFVDQISQLKSSYDADNMLMLKIDLILVLNEWLINHIQSTDMKYRPFVAPKSADAAP